jgi:ribonuclease HII
MPGLNLEHGLHAQDFWRIAGVDEAGRGPLAGPVVAAAVVLPPDLSGTEPWLKLVNDSKRLSELQRERALEVILRNALAVGVGQTEAGDIDKLGIVPATLKAMMQAVAALPLSPEHLLMDFIPMKTCTVPYQTVVRGDSISYSIAAASIVAKVTRDQLMRQADPDFPGYHFARNKGYPTAEHLAQLQALGPCLIHRRSFAPVQNSINFINGASGFNTGCEG